MWIEENGGKVRARCRAPIRSSRRKVGLAFEGACMTGMHAL